MSDPERYALGRSSAETQRLRVQAEIYAPHTAHLLALAGIAPGMRVLDVGCGAGDVSIQLARLVGPEGAVLGVDVDPVVLEVARARVAEAGLTNVSFTEARLPDVPLDEPVDAMIGRLILIHLKEPAATIRALAKLVRSGGIVSFQDFNTSRSRAVPTGPICAKVVTLIIEALRVAGANPDTGEQVCSIMRDAGLSVLGAAAEGPAGSADSVMPTYAAETLRSVLPVLTAHGLATEDEVDIDTMAKRIARELKEAGAMFWAPELSGAWARVP